MYKNEYNSSFKASTICTNNVLLFAQLGEFHDLWTSKAMKITSALTDVAVLHEIGDRIERRRIDAALTQAQLAEEAGVSKRTVERLESGRSTDFVMLLRILRALQLLEALDQMLPDLPQSPVTLLKSRGRARKRVTRPGGSADATGASSPAGPWKWRD
jgi:DNA-binding XRE family transcriptional regulator